MNIVSELVRIADIIDDVDTDGVVENVEVKPTSRLDANSKQFLKNDANYVALNMGDGSDIVSKAIEYMRVGYGDDYYDFSRLGQFFSLAYSAITFVDLRSIGLNDVVLKLEKSVNDIAGDDEELKNDCETFIVKSFGQICFKYRGVAISTVVKLAWSAYSDEVLHLVDAFFGDRFDCGKIIARNIDIDGSESRVFQLVKSQALVIWKEFYFNASAIPGSAIRFLGAAGFVENAYNRSVNVLLTELERVFRENWETLAE